MNKRTGFWSRQSAIACVQCVALLALFGSASVGLMWIWVATDPWYLPQHVRTLAEFAQQMPEPEKLWHQPGHTRDSTIVEGAIRPGSFSFGPPVFVFDHEGDLVGYSHDIGDDANDFTLTAYHSAKSNGNEVKMKEALALVDRAK